MPTPELEEARRIPPTPEEVAPEPRRDLSLKDRVIQLEAQVNNLRRGDPVYADWHEIGTAGEPAFQNGWVNFGGGAFETAAYRRDGLGVVHVKGLVKSGAVGQRVFSLPVGFRPAADIVLATLTSADVVGRLDVWDTGEVRAATGSSTWFSINCRFYADNPGNLLFR